MFYFMMCHFGAGTSLVCRAWEFDRPCCTLLAVSSVLLPLSVNLKGMMRAASIGQKLAVFPHTPAQTSSSICANLAK